METDGGIPIGTQLQAGGDSAAAREMARRHWEKSRAEHKPGRKVAFRKRIAIALAWVASHDPESPSASPLMKRLQALAKDQPVSFMNLVLKYHPPKTEQAADEALERAAQKQYDEAEKTLAEVLATQSRRSRPDG